MKKACGSRIWWRDGACVKKIMQLRSSLSQPPSCERWKMMIVSNLDHSFLYTSCQILGIRIITNVKAQPIV